jgi:energy-converting hydrogenase Eha subunit A
LNSLLYVRRVVLIVFIASIGSVKDLSLLPPNRGNIKLWESEILIPAPIIRIGWNEVSFEYAYALSPAEVTRGQNGDRRMLSVGFTRLDVTR